MDSNVRTERDKQMYRDGVVDGAIFGAMVALVIVFLILILFT